MEFIITHSLSIASMMMFLCFSAFFSGTETAFFSLSKFELAELRHEEKQSSKLILFLLHNPAKLLVSVLLGNMIVNLFFFCISAVLIAQIGGQLGGRIWQVLLGILVLLAVIIFGEVLPKALGMKNPMAIARFSCYPMTVWEYVSTPIRVIVMFISSKFEPSSKDVPQTKHEELAMLLNMGREKGTVSNKTGEMIEDIMELSELRTKNIMIPRVDVTLCSIDKTIKEAMNLAKKHKVFYLPVFQEMEDNLIGFLDIKSLCRIKNTNDPASKYIKEARFVPETKNAGELLNEMIKMNEEIVFIVDEFGGMSGKITINNILEEIVGELHYDSSKQPPVKKISKNTYRVLAETPLNDWKDLFNSPLEVKENINISSIGGLIAHLLGRLPQEGDTITYDNMNFTVEKMDKTRIKTLRIRFEHPISNEYPISNKE